MNEVYAKRKGLEILEEGLSYYYWNEDSYMYKSWHIEQCLKMIQKELLDLDIEEKV